jgi:Protein of unknown function DUF262
LAFQTPIEIAKTLSRIATHEYVLPAIQREFVWTQDQICRLFDSLMRGYPIGSMLFWQLDPKSLEDYVFYDFALDYHERNAPHCPVLNKAGIPKSKTITAILDGQQRVTALNIGLCGSHAARLPRKWWNNPDAYPKKRLHLNLGRAAELNDLGLHFDFRFLTDEEAAAKSVEGDHWYPVPSIMAAGDTAQLFKYAQDHELTATNTFAFPTLSRLHEMVHKDFAVNYFEVEDADLDTVLNLFIRVNSGGTVLSYSDLLLSIATAQWTHRDAREEIHSLVDELNSTRFGFDLSKDLVLKSGLVLADVGDVRFKVSNFTTKNMHNLEQDWDGIASSLKRAVRLLADFGFSQQTLSADSVIIPVAYYLHSAGAGENYLSSLAFKDDREAVRAWVIRSLLKQGIWGSSLDSLLTALRKELRDSSLGGFPAEPLEAEMKRLGKALRFDDAEVDDLLDTQYGQKRTFVTLALLYRTVNFEHEFHVDHVFPQSLFSKKKLLAAGVAETDVEEYRERMNGLPNLQLLPGSVNVQKQDMMPMRWLESQLPASPDGGADQGPLHGYLTAHDMGDLPEAMTGFDSFYEQRRTRMEKRLRQLLGGD